MAFGKKGRPPEDRLARQREIYNAVAPLILQVGARRLSMHQAAQAACLSIGGLYHYFPTKRDLVLHGLCRNALLRYCQDFHAQFGHLASVDPQRYVDEGINVVAEQMEFCRPAMHAAMELGTESFQEVIETLLTSTALDFEVNLRRVGPAASDLELHQCGRAIIRSIYAALLDKNVSPDELRHELRMLVNGHLNQTRHSAEALANAPVHTTSAVMVYED